MSSPAAFWKSLVGKKIVMAVTGVILFLFIVGHLEGNLLVFLGPAKYNAYSHFLKHTIIEILWVVRVILVLSLVLHIWAAIEVAVASHRARPIRYTTRKTIETNYAARTMRWSGPLIFIYVIWHLAMFTWLSTGPGYSETDVYRNVVLAFSVWWISALYILAMLLLGLHIYHGAWSMLQTLGVGKAKWRPLRKAIVPAVAIIITAGFVSIPLSVLAGWVR